VREGVVRNYIVTPEDFGLKRAPLEALAGGDATENAAILTAIFGGEPGPKRDVVLMNAAAVLLTAGIAADLREGMDRAAKAIDSGAVRELVTKLRQKS
jgi:anthranilate phosphoribosyltransferase